MIEFEELLGERLGHAFRIPELHTALGVTGSALRACCAKFLGMNPTRYALLRRLRQARIALREAKPGAVDIAELAHRLGFAQAGRFAVAYRAAFGETPAATLQRAPGTRFATR